MSEYKNFSPDRGELSEETRELFADLRRTIAADTVELTEEETITEVSGDKPQAEGDQPFEAVAETEDVTEQIQIDESPEGPAVASPPVFTEEMPAGPAAAGPDVPGPTGQTVASKAPLRVGLLVWGVILMLVGLLMMVMGLSLDGSLQLVLVGSFVIAGVAFLVLAVTTSKSANSQG